MENVLGTEQDNSQGLKTKIYWGNSQVLFPIKYAIARIPCQRKNPLSGRILIDNSRKILDNGPQNSLVAAENPLLFIFQRQSDDFPSIFIWDP